MTGFGVFSGREDGEDVGGQQHQVDDAGQQVRPSSTVRDDGNDETKGHQHARACGYSQFERLSNRKRGESNHWHGEPDGALSAQASLLWDWSYTGSGIDVGGTFTTNEATSSDGYYE